MIQFTIMKPTIMRKFGVFVCALMMFFVPIFIMYAATPIDITIENPLKGSSTLYGFIKDVIDNIIVPIGGVLATLYIIYAGFLLVTARGDEKQITQGKTAFLHAAIGTAILLGAWVIATVIETTINSLTSLTP